VRLLDTNGFANAHMRPFSANTGQVFVKIGRERWPAGHAVSDASTVEQIKVVRGSCPTLCVHPRCLREWCPQARIGGCGLPRPSGPMYSQRAS
jgi:hypothetical protein